MSVNSDKVAAEECVLALARQARDGSSAAFTELVDLHVERLHHYLRHRVGSAHDAEDLVQETFLRAYQALDRYEPGRSFSTWLFTIATRLAISFLRQGPGRRAQSADAAAEVADSRQAGPHESAQQAEDRRNLWGLARRELTAGQFTVVWLHYVEDMPVAQIAAVTARTRIGVKVLLHRGRKRLLKKLAGPASAACGTAALGCDFVCGISALGCAPAGQPKRSVFRLRRDTAEGGCATSKTRWSVKGLEP